MTRVPRVALAALAAIALASCGSDSNQGASLTISERFGSRIVLQRDGLPVSDDETALTLAARSAQLVPRDDGTWSVFVNGVSPEKRAASARVRAGDRVWWDRAGGAGAAQARAVVGSFPEPFRRGIDGKRLPVRVECTEARGAACVAVADRLTGFGVVAAQGGLQRSLTRETLRVLVGPWAKLRADPAVSLLADGHRESGVHAQVAADGRSIAVLDARGRMTRTLRAGGGLVAATRLEDAQPVWIVTGMDDRGVLAAARALTEDALGDRYAIAIAGERTIALPDRTAPASANE